MIRQNGGWSNFDMIIVKKFPCKFIYEVEAEKYTLAHREELKNYITSLGLGKST
jgi:hypothetical protein